MSRLTKKALLNDNKTEIYVSENIAYLYADKLYSSKEINKLGKYEDIEEELGCPLEVVFKALNDGIYFKKDNITLHCIVNSITNVSLNCDASYYTENHKYSVNIWCEKYSIDFKDYKKTWWLKTREE